MLPRSASRALRARAVAAWSRRGSWRLEAANRDPRPGRPIGSLQEAADRSVVGAVECRVLVGRTGGTPRTRRPSCTPRSPANSRLTRMPWARGDRGGRRARRAPAKLHAAIAAITPAEANAAGTTATAGLDTRDATVG